MKLILKTVIFMILFAVSIFGVLVGSLVFAHSSYAGNYSPNDFHLQNFEVKTGIDKNMGRYYTYHYEFDE